MCIRDRLYTGQMCTAPQNIYVPPTVATDQGELSFDDVAQRLAGAIAKLTGDDAKAVDVIGATVNPQVRAHADAHAAVSYTHLDVYKRQATVRATGLVTTGPASSCAIRAWSGWPPSIVPSAAYV